MYNSINPVNISYKRPNQSLLSAQAYAAQQEKTPVNPDDKGQKQQQHFPNGTKVAIDYSKNSVNISQIVTDFKSTIIAINAPKDVSDEVNSYLSLVEKESAKQNPQRDIILSNLKNASRVSDAYIAKSLNKPSKVVEGWIDALFMQKIELKADPTHINPDFQLEIPEKKPKTFEQTKAELLPKNEPLMAETTAVPVQNDDTFSDKKIIQSANIFEAPDNFETQKTPAIKVVEPKENVVQHPVKLQAKQDVALNKAENIKPAKEVVEQAPKQIAKKETVKEKPVYVSNDHDKMLSKSLKTAQLFIREDDPASALTILNNTLGEAKETTNPNLRAAIHFERGKIFDDYDYVNYALRDYFEATKADDNNLKSKAHLNMARIYDDFVEFESAFQHYQDAVAYSGEAENVPTQTKILGEVTSFFASRYDRQGVFEMGEATLETAKTSNDAYVISNAFCDVGKSYEYIGEDRAALDCFKNAAKNISFLSETAKNLNAKADNYEAAAGVMERLGNLAKADSLLSKARLYRQKAELSDLQEAV